VPDDVLFVVRAMAPLPGVYHPEDQGQHHRRRDHHQADVNPPAVPPQARAVVLLDGCERVADEGAVLQLNQERAVLIQPSANSYATFHLTVDPRGNTTHRGANLSSLDSFRLALKAPVNLQFVQRDTNRLSIFKPTEYSTCEKRNNITKDSTSAALSKVTSPLVQVRLFRSGVNGLHRRGISGPDWL
jgi:hypothetical protein